MTALHGRFLFWTPRILAIAYIAFLSMFALDVFSEEHGFWRILGALLVHLIPSLVLLAALILAWRWEWIGAALFSAAGLLYIFLVVDRPVSIGIKLIWVMTISVPAFLVGALFFANWRKRDELHPRHP